MQGVEAPRRLEPGWCECGAEIWNPYAGVCDACFRVLWLEFARTMGWDTRPCLKCNGKGCLECPARLRRKAA